MTSTLTKTLLKKACQSSVAVMRGRWADFYEYESSRRYRILIQADDGTEVDLEYDKVLRVSRLWIDGRDVRETN